MRELSRKTGLTVFLATRDGDEIIYIDKIEEHESFRRYSIIGTRQPLYCTSLGRAFLMGETDGEVRAALARIDLLPRTPATITDKDGRPVSAPGLVGRPGRTHRRGELRGGSGL